MKQRVGPIVRVGEEPADWRLRGPAERQLVSIEASARVLSPMSPVTAARMRRSVLALEEEAAAEFAVEIERVTADPWLVALEARLCAVSGLDVRLLGGGRLTELGVECDVALERMGPLP